MRELSAVSECWSVQIATRESDGGERRTRVWIVCHGDDVYVRTTGMTRWGANARARPGVAVLGKGQRISARAEPVHEEDLARAVNRAYARKYGVLGRLGELAAPLTGGLCLLRLRETPGPAGPDRSG